MIDLATATPEDFPRYGDRACPHEGERQRDGHGEVCLDCGAILLYG